MEYRSSGNPMQIPSRFVAAGGRKLAKSTILHFLNFQKNSVRIIRILDAMYNSLSRKKTIIKHLSVFFNYIP